MSPGVSWKLWDHRGLKEWDHTPTRRWGWPLMVPQSDTVRAACRKDETERTHLEKR